MNVVNVMNVRSHQRRLSRLHRYTDDESLYWPDGRGAVEGNLGRANRADGAAGGDCQCRPPALFGRGWIRHPAAPWSWTAPRPFNSCTVFKPG